ncbi:MAG: alpha/beta hydrolase [Sulfurospirillaceae bacterium]|jgi:pimeloyl-ACP methyl ester carboxylesterase|nr:alpha/beta hydrolase [Sulfurospirillaceae bacterium]MDD2827367.1 alpha/beta hydrolase [Sulfurospirillaceae bacterium]
MALKEISYQNHTFTISYELLNQEAQNTILFLHGWGSSKEAMRHAFSQYFKSYKHVYVDLPGFGNSSIDMILDTHEYAKIISFFLKQIGCEPNIVFGHSYGGKVATILNPPKLVLLSTAGIVVPKSWKVKTKIWLYKSLKPLLPQHFYKYFAAKDVDGMNQTMYGVFKKVVNEDFSDIFSKRKQETYIFWGKEDLATPLESGKTIHKLVENSYFYVLDGDHFFFLKQGNKINSLLEKFGI